VGNAPERGWRKGMAYFKERGYLPEIKPVFHAKISERTVKGLFCSSTFGNFYFKNDVKCD
jgi:hypothetical protein